MADDDIVPQKFDLKKVKVTPVSDDAAPVKFDLKKITVKPLGEQDFHVDGEGNYQMAGADGKYIPVSYSQVQAASEAGYNMHPTDRIKYVNDSAADVKLKNQSPAPGVKVVGKNSAGQNILAPEEPQQQGSAVGRFLSSAGSAIGGAAKGAYQAVVDDAKTPEEQAIVARFPASPVQAHAALVAYRMGVAPAIEQGKKTVEELKQSAPTSLHPTQEQLWHRQKAGGHALATVLPVVGPWAAQVAEQSGTQIGSGDVAGGVGTLAGNAALYEAPHAIGKGAELVAKAPRATLEAVTDTSPRGIKEIAEEVQKKNEEAKQKAQEQSEKAQKEYDDKKAEADHATTGREIGRKYDIKQTAQEQAADHQQKTADVEAHNARVWDKTSKKYMQDVKDVRDANQKTVAKHVEEKQRIEDENKAAEHALELRRSEEAGLEKDTTDYFTKEDAVKDKVKGAADAKWQPVHQTLDDKTIDGGDIEKPLAKIIEISPEVRREISQLIPDPADVDPESNYGKERQRVMESSGYPKGTRYFDLPEAKRIDIDKMTASSGFEPDPIDFDPTVGVGLTFDKVHRAQSVIGRNIRNGRYGYEGPLLGEMIQLQKILHNAESKIAADHGMTAVLDEARKATREYQEAFGRARNTPKSQVDIRKQQANPEQFKEEQEEERVAAASKHDPDLGKEYEKVKQRREALKKLKTEDQLRKSIQRVPQPPTEGDLRPGYSLKSFPVYEPPTIDDLRDSHRLKPRPSLPPAGAAAQAVKEPERVSPGNEPQPVIPKTETISPEDYQARKIEHIKATARNLRATGLRRGLYATLTGLPFAVIELFKGAGAAGATEAALGGIAAGGVVLAGSHILANLIERPDVTAWLSRVTEKDAAVWDKLPPEQKALFTQDMKQLVDAANKKGVKVSPAMAAFVAGSAASQQDKKSPGPQSSVKASPKDMLAQAAALQDSFHRGGFAQNPSSAPVAQQASAQITHRFNPTTGQIEAA